MGRIAYGAEDYQHTRDWMKETLRSVTHFSDNFYCMCIVLSTCKYGTCVTTPVPRGAIALKTLKANSRTQTELPWTALLSWLTGTLAFVR